MLNSVYTYLLNTHTVKCFQVLPYNSHNLTSVIRLHTICSIWSIDRILYSATTLDQSRLRNNGNERVLHIPQISKAESPTIRWFNVISRTLIGSSYTCVEMQLVYSTYPANWAGYRSGKWSTSSLPLHLGQLWPGQVVLVKVLSMSQIELCNHLQYLKPINYVQTN